VENTRINMSAVILGMVLVLLGSAMPVAGDEIYAPEYLWKRGIADKTNPVEIANTHLGIPYRADGALDTKGYFTSFGRPDRRFGGPGLNCSGLVVSVSRFIFDRGFPLEQVTKDRQGNSGEGSRQGKDWDFGWDLILNVSDVPGRTVLMPDGSKYNVDSADPMTLRGFDLHDQSAWANILSRMKPGNVYLGTISKPTRKRGYRLLHYHVVLMLPDAKGNVWLYHSTRRSGVHRMNLNSDRGMRRLMSQFRNRRGQDKKILVVEAPVRGIDTPQPEERDREAPRSAQSNQTSGAVSDALIRTVKTTVGRQPNPGEHVGLTAQATESTRQAGEVQTDQKPQQKQVQEGPDLVINHLKGTVINPVQGMVTRVPKFPKGNKEGVKLWFRNRDDSPRKIEIVTKGPLGDLKYEGRLSSQGQEVELTYPQDFGTGSTGAIAKGRYAVEVRIDGTRWIANLFEVAVRKEARPKITNVRIPGTVKAGRTFSIKVAAQNQGVESDYGGITVSCPDPSGLRLVSANPGRIYGRGSSVLSVMSDKIRTSVPMAERWIDLWPENKSYDMTVKVKALKPGTYPIYVRCALRGVSVKSSVVLMDPKAADDVDQQGFPVYVYDVTVR
jgi:hypothetical protein